MLYWRVDTSQGGSSQTFTPAVNTLYDLVLTRTAGTYAMYINGSAKVILRPS